MTDCVTLVFENNIVIVFKLSHGNEKNNIKFFKKSIKNSKN